VHERLLDRLKASSKQRVRSTLEAIDVACPTSHY
jgi:hypothetical protein